MKQLILSESAIGVGLVMWFAAALFLPFQLGSSGSGWQELGLYVVCAGLLFTVGDILSGMTFWRGPGDMLVQGALRAIGFAVPAAMLFALGHMAAPAAEDMEDDVCALGGYSEMADGDSGAADLMLDGSADCAPA